MVKPMFKYLIALVFVPACMVACASMKDSYQLPEKHPPIYDLGERRAYCVRCHGHDEGDVDFARYNHTVLFTDSHRLVAYQDEKVCAICHQQSFCNDCHVSRSELKPSVRYQTQNYRRTQHRGDYLTRHKIDAKVDPSSCFRCHGNPKSSQTCVPCHGK